MQPIELQPLSGSEREVFGLGWMPDIPDYRDYNPEHPKIQPMVSGVGLADTEKLSLPAQVSLVGYCSPIEDQGALGSCTAQAGVGLLEYYERRAYRAHIDASRLFLYKVTRNLLGWTGDTGAYLRTTMGAMALFGVPPERYWRYTTARPGPVAPQPEAHFDLEPPAFCYQFADAFKAIRYFRLDQAGISMDNLRDRIKAYIAAGLPSMFGFTVYSSINQAGTTGKIPFPCPGEGVAGGHAVVAVGYDDSIRIENTTCGSETRGAFLIRNSWGTRWGDKGYGWLPYAYVERGLARDWWVLFKADYVDTRQFGL